MSVVAAVLYRNGSRVRDLDVTEKVHCPTDKSEFVWIGLLDPTPDDLRSLQEQYALHPLAVEDAISGKQIPKVDVYNDQLFVTARTAELVGDQIHYGEISIFVGHSHIITVRHGQEREFTKLRGQLEQNPGMLQKGVDYVLHAILDYIVDGYLPIIETIEEDTLAMERQTVDSFLGRDEVIRIFSLRREVIRFQRILIPMGEVAAKFVRGDLPCIDQDARPYFSDVNDHVRRVQALADGLKEVLNSVFEFSNLLEQQRTGAITRQLAAWAAILAVPTAIAGIYGMNFKNMPELETRYGYFYVLIAITAICMLLYWRFKKLKWL
ncbi:magnesium and cobalt transport protein CorA, putative [Novosphingobium sp. Rr 2-17]|uniref:magnesium and cobalt transport protein CorA n=1 Tax=Novosphingobium sp. Rr 2-17 TaxID=555793 RepID=UPI000269A888|nr:magnesium and cobalt transport protein CorA [Novosphingobium sp. Rr 2-17]EIZ77209.1 magnesium and cobalt transport protein CorA, putative [Novosphingobium sp. Rr 2-17]